MCVREREICLCSPIVTSFALIIPAGSICVIAMVDCFMNLGGEKDQLHRRSVYIVIFYDMSKLVILVIIGLKKILKY